MKLKQKYFIPFLAIGALLTALLITYFTISSQNAERQAFRKAIVRQDSLKTEFMSRLEGSDSLSVRSFAGKYVVLDFWATWSNFSEEVHRDLAALKQKYPDKLEVVAAVVKDRRDKVRSYVQNHDYPFVFVDGGRIFNRYGFPGIPVELVYTPEGEIKQVFFGYSGPAHFDSLKTILEDAR